MKTLFAFVSALAIGTFSLAQNLVPNNSFENKTQCPVGPGEITSAIGWSNPDTSTADYFNVCNTGSFPLPSLSVPSNIMGYQQARTGVAYGGIICNEVVNFPPLPAFEDDYREYLQIQLTSPLVAGQEYNIEFYWSLANNSTHYVEELGVYLSNTHTFLQQNTALPFTPQVSVSGTPLNDTVNWVLFSQPYTAVGGEEYIIIGNFNDPANTTSGTTGVPSNINTGGDHAYYYIEDVNVSPATCFEIEKILVDACGSPEGQNEMLTFRVGNQDLNVNDLTVTWPSTNPWGGIIQNAQTAQLVSDLNATITACGHLIEPTGGILPAGSEVLLITGPNFDPLAHSFANLNDTLVVIVQNSNATGGHFANYNASGGTRTLTMSFSNPNGCSDVVSYERDLLVNQNGGYGGTSSLKDGAFVSFTADGTPTYDNLGCQIPAGLLSIDVTASTTSACNGDTLVLTANVQGSFSVVTWHSTGGTFPNGNAGVNPNFVVTANSPFYIYGGVISNCNDTIYDSVQINISNTAPIVSVSASNDTLCSGQNVTLTASGASSYEWSNGSTSNPLMITSGGNYWVVGHSGCGSDTAHISIYEMSAPTPISTTSPLISCDSNALHQEDLSNYTCESCTVQWSDGSNGTTFSTTEQNYTLTISNYCGTINVNYNYDVYEVNADISVQDSIGEAPFVPVFQNNSTGATAYTWDFGNGLIGTTPSTSYETPGEYLVTLVAFNNYCSDADYQTIIVTGTPVVIIPNIFSPDNNSINDEFKITTEGVKDLNGTIYNRWGRKVHELKGVDATWNGAKASEGTYYYVIKVVGIDDSIKDYTGTIQLVRKK